MEERVHDLNVFETDSDVSEINLVIVTLGEVVHWDHGRLALAGRSVDYSGLGVSEINPVIVTLDEVVHWDHAFHEFLSEMRIRGVG